MANTQAHGPARSSLDQGAPLIRLICQIAGARSLIDDARVGLARPGVIAAVQRHDTPAIFNWLIDALSYQGVSDSIAYGYMEQHGRSGGKTSPPHSPISRAARSSRVIGCSRIAGTGRTPIPAPTPSIGPIAPCRDMICATGG